MFRIQSKISNKSYKSQISHNWAIQQIITDVEDFFSLVSDKEEIMGCSLDDVTNTSSREWLHRNRSYQPGISKLLSFYRVPPHNKWSDTRQYQNGQLSGPPNTLKFASWIEWLSRYNDYIISWSSEEDGVRKTREARDSFFSKSFRPGSFPTQHHILWVK